MPEQIDIRAKAPNDFTDAELSIFRELVVEAGEVVGAALKTNIANARNVVLLEKDGATLGVAALKRPQENYREKIGKNASFSLPISTYPYELGYVFIKPILQGLGLSHRLVSIALEHSDGSSVFATVRTDNAAMRAVLRSAGFVSVGEPYLGLSGRQIGLLVRRHEER
ncbi:MAG: GNAT family N-acetyltransferase [Luteibacter sp.]|uniref:GNAT family N-acetyltransferase n=1 Tax=Luteibacter sp. TaxID=1886636 RepID=UPI0028070F6F|nr:GNAT family N-acetyltransferase [Luteibacter sp.]MDQ7994976.1 hypothetical protein [Luteibacter sp.]MDQ8047508.1 hypothetical protein [Luteibacter sp.]